jgi:hypothetical protein
MSDNPFQGPGPDFASKPLPRRISNPNPAVLKWQMVYLTLMVLLYSALAVGSIVLFAFAERIAESDKETDPVMIQFMAIFYGLFALAFATIHAVGLFWRRGTGGWIYQIVLIALGLSQCWTWPATIPLLIYWIKHKDDIVTG